MVLCNLEGTFLHFSLKSCVTKNVAASEAFQYDSTETATFSLDSSLITAEQEIIFETSVCCPFLVAVLATRELQSAGQTNYPSSILKEK